MMDDGVTMLSICMYIMYTKETSTIWHYFHYLTGPKPQTVEDLWRMIWLLNINRIVMLTQLTETRHVRNHSKKKLDD